MYALIVMFVIDHRPHILLDSTFVFDRRQACEAAKDGITPQDLQKYGLPTTGVWYECLRVVTVDANGKFTDSTGSDL